MVMNSDEYVINNRMVFYFALVMMYGEEFIFVDNLSDLLRSFTIDNINEHYNELKLIYKVQYRNKKFTFSEPADLRRKTFETFNILHNNFNYINKFYDYVGEENTEKLSELAMEFCNYLNNFSSVKRELLPQ